MSDKLGRPRDASLDAAIAAATESVLLAEGYAAVSIDRVARIAGTTRAAGVGARSATASGEAACRVAESICTAPDAAPAMPPQVAVGSPTIFAAGDGNAASHWHPQGIGEGEVRLAHASRQGYRS